MTPIDKERLDKLAGARGKAAIRKAAVTIEDLQSLLEMPLVLQSAEATGSTPTKAEHDALVADVKAIHRRLVAVVAALQARIL